jgi:hypothetical protein
LFGTSTEIAVLATLELNKGRADIVPVDARLSDGTGLPVPGAVQKQILNLFRIPLITGDLPLNVSADTFEAKDGTLQISGTARNLTLD